MIFRKSKSANSPQKNLGAMTKKPEREFNKAAQDKNIDSGQESPAQEMSLKKSFSSKKLEAVQPAGLTSKDNPDITSKDRLGITAKDSNVLFLEILLLAMKAKETQGLSLTDLEWFLLPPVRYNQAVVAEARLQEGGKPAPIGFLLWAKVSSEVDARLASDKSPLPRLAPQEWQSGTIPWVIAAAGRPEIVRAMLSRVVKEQLHNQLIKLRVANSDGSFSVREVRIRPESDPSQSVNPLS